jgi:DNA-directed RNA polymerase subunit RPC12/RpoP
MSEKTQKYSCYTCHCHFELDIADKKPKCPECGEIYIQKRCAADPFRGCHCALTVNAGIKYCDVCGKVVCPTCGDHDVLVLSRVTGYLQDVSGWNAGKQQELRDRFRSVPQDIYNITSNI